MNKKQKLMSLLVVIFMSVFVNHLRYGNSNSTISQYEMIQEYQRKQIKIQSSKNIADHMYNRIKFYQSLDMDFYGRFVLFTLIYNKLIERDNNEGK